MADIKVKYGMTILLCDTDGNISMGTLSQIISKLKKEDTFNDTVVCYARYIWGNEILRCASFWKYSNEIEAIYTDIQKKGVFP